MSKTFTASDVAKHTATASDGQYIIIDSTVYDVTNFIDEHPGGAKILKRVCGKDASKQFWKVRLHSECAHICRKWDKRLGVGNATDFQDQTR